MRRLLPGILGGVIAFGCARALAGLDVPPAPTPAPSAPDLSSYAKKTDIPGAPDLSPFAQKSELQTAVDAMNAAVAGVASAGNKLNAVPTTGPGAGKCRITVVPSELITSGGVVGTAGTCTRIVQCGTSAVYTVVQFNLGGGC